MANSTFNLDDGAFDGSTREVIQPHTIQQVDEEYAVVENAEVNLQNPQPLPVVLQDRGEEAASPNTEDTSLDLVMAHASDLQMFREYEGYRFGLDYSDSDSDVPEDYSSEGEAEEEVAPIEEVHTD